MNDDVQKDVRALEDIRERLEAAENAGNSDSIVDMMAEDVVLMVPDQPAQEGTIPCASFGREVLAALLAQFDRRIRYMSAEVRVIGDAAFDTAAAHRLITP